MNHLERALDHQNQWWKYLLVFVIGFFAGQLIGAIPLLIVIVVKVIQNGGPITPPANSMDLAAFGIDPNFGFALVVLPFIVSLIVAIILIQAFHKRTYKDVINGGRQIRWSKFFSGFVIWAIFMCIYFALDINLNPDNFEFQFNPVSFIPLVIIALIFIPFQAGTEEFLFRGYLAQGIAGWTKIRWLVILIPSLLFGLMHGLNPEVEEYGFWIVMPQYILFGLVFGIISTLDDGIEMAIGVHTANNVLSALLVTNKASVLQTPALFMQKEIDPIKEFWVLLAFCIVLIGIMSYTNKWEFSVLRRKIH